MTVKHVTAVLESEGWPSPAALAVIVVAAYRTDRSGVIRISQSEIAATVHTTKRTVGKWFEAFENGAIIQRVRQGRYQFIVDTQEAMSDLLPHIAYRQEYDHASSSRSDTAAHMPREAT